MEKLTVIIMLLQDIHRFAVVYLSIKYTERLADAGLEPSVCTVGDSYDNALAETMIGLFKAEVIHRFATKNQLSMRSVPMPGG